MDWEEEEKFWLYGIDKFMKENGDMFKELKNV